MGVRYRQSIRLGKGARINISKSGIGLSVGGKGFRYSVHSSGRKTATFGIPKTGISYTTSTSRKKKSGASTIATRAQAQIQAQAKAQAEAQLKENKEAVAQYEEYLHRIETLHQKSIDVVDWYLIEQTPPPFIKGEKGPRERKAEQKHDNFRPNIFEKMVKSDGSRRKEKLLDKVSIAREEDQAEFDDWQSTHDLAYGIIHQDPEAYPYAMETYAPLEEISEYCSDFDFIINSPQEITVEFDAHGKEVIPPEEKSLTKTGKLSSKPLSKAKYFDYLQDYVCSCAVKIARDLFAVLPVNFIVVNVKDYVLNTTNGFDEMCYILSVRFTREAFNTTNFNRIDTSDFVESFEHNMKFAKTTGFKPTDTL